MKNFKLNWTSAKNYITRLSLLIISLYPAHITLFPLLTYSQDGWINQMKEIHAGLYDIHSPQGVTNWDGDLYWVVGDSGLVMKSSGSPTALSRQETKTTANLRGVYFFLDGSGFCVGEKGTYIISRNFGNTWSQVPLNTVQNLNDIWFINDTAGYILGDSGLFLVTANRGMTWNPGNLVTDNKLNKLCQFTNSRIWIVGDSGSVYKTTDAGNSWQSVATGYNTDFNDIYLADDYYAYIVGDDGLVIKTDDGGTIWQDFSIPDTADLYGITGVNCYTLYVCGENGAIYKSTPSNPSWQAYQGPTDGLDFNLAMYEQESGYFYFLADTGYYTYATLYGYGFPQQAGENLYLGPTDFPDSKHGFVGGDFVTLFHTKDGGEHWYSLHLGDFEGNAGSPSVRDIEFYDSLTGWVALDRYYNGGEHSYIFKTDDGGISWALQYQSLTTSVKKLCFIDQDHGWVAGNDGFVMKTDDGGETWVVLQAPNPELELTTDLYFNNLLDGYLVRGSAEFLVTHDGGYSWQLKNTFRGRAEDLFVLQDSSLWLLMNFSGLNISKDGGNTWNNFPFPYNSHNVHSLFFLDENEGWACGGGPSLWRTHDGGENWEYLYEGQYLESFNDMIFTDSLNGWLIGQYGSIMHGPGLYTGIEDAEGINSQELSIYPNPAKNIISINIPGAIQGQNSVSVYNVNGQQVLSQRSNAVSGSFKIDVSTFQPGLYIAVIRQEGRILCSGKFMVLTDR